MLPEAWDCAARLFMDLVDGPRSFISEAMLAQFLPKASRRWPFAPSPLFLVSHRRRQPHEDRRAHC